MTSQPDLSRLGGGGGTRGFLPFGILCAAISRVWFIEPSQRTLQAPECRRVDRGATYLYAEGFESFPRPFLGADSPPFEGNLTLIVDAERQKHTSAPWLRSKLCEHSNCSPDQAVRERRTRNS